MKVFINEQTFECETGITLSEILIQAGIATEYAAVAIDEQIIPRKAWSETRLQEGNNIMIIRASHGG